MSRLNEPIAIIGVGLRVPGADSPETFLRLLRARVCRIGPATANRCIENGQPGGYLDQVDQADWRALGIPPREMRHVDPQHRLLLEVAREAIEDAGLTSRQLAQNRVAVACGLIWDDYLRALEREGRSDGYSVLGNVASFAANRISYHFDFKGPSIALNAACASGLVAVHEACKVLRMGEADLALAGACELILSAETGRMMEKLGVLSPSGHCLPLDAKADGFVRGEGAGMVVLKPLANVKAYERVYAVIAGSAVNHNGRNEWIMASSETALRDVVVDACAAAGITPDDLAYVELHGSGGTKGDAAEIRSLAGAGQKPCRVGSVKGNLGHLGAASGIASFIKVALSLEAGEWLPTILEEPREDVDWSRLAPALTVEPWAGSPYAGVTATSLSGANAHVVLKAVDKPLRPVDRTVYLVPVSAHSAPALAQRVDDLRRWVEGHPEVPLGDVAFTAAFGRDVLAHATTIELGEGNPHHEIPRTGRIVSLPPFPWQRESFTATSKPQRSGASVQSAIQRVLDLPEPPSVDTPFFELGLNSMAIAELSQKLGIPAAAFFEFPTIAKLAAGPASRLAPVAASSDSAIAVIGMGCRFPGGANTPEQFWRLLHEGRDAFGLPPEARGLSISRGAFLDEVDGFDAAFFRMSPREAAHTDPQQRLFLEVIWEALENAGVDPVRLEGTRTGVYAGAFAHDYEHLKGPVDAYHFSGMDIAFNANRVSFALGLRGPSLTVDTACSSSLVALHLAVRALRGGECEIALAGGVSLMLSSDINDFLQAAGTLSVGGTCRAFDRDADGMVRGEGCGVVVLKRLNDAQAAGDRILAVIRGTAVNHGGASGGLTVPNPAAQAELYRAALADGGISDNEVGYIEAHGTGTKLGDPVELRGISQVYRGALRIGSVKTNIGHTDAAAGIAGFIKAVLMLTHAEVPPSLQFRTPTPEFDWGGHKFSVPAVREPLGGGRVAVSSFGLGGTNAHVVLEGVPGQTPGKGAGAVLLPLSARSPEALELLAGSISRVMKGEAKDVCWTAARSRAGMPYRLAVAGRDTRVLAERLARGQATIQKAVERPNWPTTFVFPGQGGQWHGMGRGLCTTNPSFAEKIAEIDAFFKPLAGRGILDSEEETVHETAVAQPAIFAMQVGLAAAWGRMGIRPAIVVGHSMGEIAAAHVAGCLDVKDAVTIIFERSRILQQASAEGRMLAAALSPEEAQDLVDPFLGQVAVGVVNGPRSVVLSGAISAIEVLAQDLRDRGVFCRELQVRYASHCPQMNRFEDPVRRALTHIRPHDGTVAFHSTMLGRVVRGRDLDASYWAANFREPVLFAPAIIALAKQGFGAFVELSPHPTLDTALASCLEEAGSDAVSVASIHRGEPEDVSLLDSVGQLYCAGYPIDFLRVNPTGRMVELPNYPWQRQRYWIASPAKTRNASGHALLGERVVSPLPQEQYLSQVSRKSPEFLAGHRLRQEVYFPAAGMIEMALAARNSNLRGVQFEAPLILEDQAVRLQLTIDGDRFSIHSSRDGQHWERHATGIYGNGETGPVSAGDSLAAVDGFYEALERRGYHYENDFRAIRTIQADANTAVAEVVFPEGEFRFHPAGLDGCLQASLALTKGGIVVPVSMDAFELLRSPKGDVRVTVRRRHAQFDMQIEDAQGVCARIEGLTLRAIGAERPAWQDWCFRTVWAPTPPPATIPRIRMRFRIAGPDGGLRQFLEDRGHVCVDESDPDTPLDHVMYFAAGDDFEEICGGALRLAQSLETLHPAPRLWLVTRGAQSLDETPVAPGQAGLWGLGRTIARELPFLACTNVDLDPETSDMRGLWGELTGEPGESQVMLRRGKRYVLRMEPVRFGRKVTPFRIGLEEYGRLDALKEEPLTIPKPGPGEVLIRTERIGLNFRDVLNALGMLPEYAAELGIQSPSEMTFGFECGGIVEAIGEGVTRVAPGDAVVAAPIKAALATHVLVDAGRVIAAPRELAALPVAYMTASYALESLAKLKSGERVLIHAAAGGVGMMAVQIAQRIGAEVYATAHPDKWPPLRAMGVRHIMSSRDKNFGDMAVNADVVLNSLTGTMIDASLRACAPGARFIEIGKKDIWPAERVTALRADVAYHAFTFSEVADRRPELVEELLNKLKSAPRLPVTRFAAAEIPAAFQFMAQARHVGKVVIEMPRQGGMTVRSDGTYWVTGGRGALGMSVANWLVEQGAGRVLLSGRSAGVSSGPALDERIEYWACDVSSAAAVERLVAGIGASLRGVVHAAGVIDDGVIAAQSQERFRRVYEPKGVAVRNIAAATAELQLDFLVLFSSTAAILGPPGQANYAAANASMDAMAHNLRAEGRPALSIQWGPWGDHGLAAALSDENRKRLAARGMEFMGARACLAAMDALAGTDLAQAAVAPVHWERYVASLPPGCPTAMFERLARARNTARRNLMAELDAAPATQRRGVLENFVRDQIARSLGMADGNTIGERQRLFDLGFDSLMAVELRNRLEGALKKPLRRTLAFDFPRVDALTEHLADVLGLPARAQAETTEAEETPGESLDAELESRLAAASQYLGEEL